MVTAGSQWELHRRLVESRRSSVLAMLASWTTPRWVRAQRSSLSLSRCAGQCKWGAASGRRGRWTLSMQNQSEARAGRDQPIEGAA